MRIQKITVDNFKGFPHAEFYPSQFSCLVGENNAGKSTILQSIVTALNRPAKIPTELHYNKLLPVSFAIEILDISPPHLLRLAEEHRAKIESIVKDGRLVLIVKYDPGERVDVKVEISIPNEDRYRDEEIGAVFAGKRGAAILQALSDNFPEFLQDAPSLPTIGAAKAYLAERIKQLPEDQFVVSEGPLPSGISASINALLPEAIYIPAVKNLNDELKTTQSTSFGRLLGLLLEDMAPALTEIDAALAQLNSFFNRVEQEGNVIDERHALVKTLESSVEGFLKDTFPNARVEVRVPPPELKTILNAAQIFIDDGSNDLVENKGDGIKRSLTFALLQCYTESLAKRAAESENPDAPPLQPLIFLFEEPELYLHPKSQRILFNNLARISDSHQVLVTTHSPLFFSPGVTASFVRVSKQSADPKPVGILHHVNFKLDAASAEVFRMARFENADAAFFCERVVLFEGESDDAYFKHIARLMNPEWDFEAKNVAMVRVSGKGNFGKFRRFFEAFGITVKIVADLDAFFDGFAHLGAPPAIGPLRATALAIIDARVLACNIKAEPASRQIKDRIHGSSWRDRYETAKATLRLVQETKVIDQDALNGFEGLFTWEQDIARVKACREDAAACAAAVSVFDALRVLGICVLSRGAIEDYYHANAPATGPKPERAMSATQLVVTSADALSLSSAFSQGREPELAEICGQLFSN